MTWIVLGPYMIRLCDVSVVETEEIGQEPHKHVNLTIHLVGGNTIRHEGNDADRDRLVYALHAAELEPVCSGLVVMDTVTT